MAVVYSSGATCLLHCNDNEGKSFYVPASLSVDGRRRLSVCSSVCLSVPCLILSRECSKLKIGRKEANDTGDTVRDVNKAGSLKAKAKAKAKAIKFGLEAKAKA